MHHAYELTVMQRGDEIHVGTSFEDIKASAPETDAKGGPYEDVSHTLIISERALEAVRGLGEEKAGPLELWAYSVSLSADHKKVHCVHGVSFPDCVEALTEHIPALAEPIFIAFYHRGEHSAFYTAAARAIIDPE
ncbi:hypothetical protein CMO91_04710 [Candidatus Woesearchaeota archaeon]|nr:hypothetical protein [Candidatus Woesearchaeota archaeon]